MPVSRVPSPESREIAANAIATEGLLTAAHRLALSPTTLKRASKGLPVSPETLARIAPKSRKAADYASPVVVAPPRREKSAGEWSLEALRGARDSLLRGRFDLPSRLALAMRCNDAIAVAREARVAPQFSINTSYRSAGGARGDAVLRRAERSIHLPRGHLAQAAGEMADFGLSVAYIRRETSEDGSLVEMQLEPWPLEFVQWDPILKCLTTAVDGGLRVPIVHGDGDWCVISKYRDQPWLHGAILPLILVFAGHSDALRDWNATSASHGLAKILGSLPEGFAIRDGAEDGEASLSPEVRLFLETLQLIASGDAVAGVIPFGAKADFLANASSAWQIFTELAGNRERAAARIYLGTDAILGAGSGAPGVDIAALFGLASTKLQGDCTAISESLSVGLFQPWAAINAGDSRLAPSLKYHLPDPDQSRASDEQDQALGRLFAALDKLRANQMVIDQDTVNRYAAIFGVDRPPVIAPAAANASSRVPIALAPTDLAKVILVKEARASQGLPPFGDSRDDLTISQLEALAKPGAAPAPGGA